MRSHTFRILVLTWICAWFGFVAPAHQRGIARVTGATQTNTSWELGSIQSDRGCCKATASSSSISIPDSENDSPDVPDPVPTCALCDIIAKLDLPASIDLTPPSLGFAEVADWRITNARYASKVVSNNLGRAPPLV